MKLPFRSAVSIFSSELRTGFFIEQLKILSISRGSQRDNNNNNFKKVDNREKSSILCIKGIVRKKLRAGKLNKLVSYRLSG